MVLKNYTVNFDFEWSINNFKTKLPLQQKFARECVFFFIEKDGILYTNNPHFNDEYFKYLKNTFGINAKTTNKGHKPIGWWGPIEEKEKKVSLYLNSKLELLKIKKLYGLDIPNTAIIKKGQNFSNQESVMIQDPFGCSGLGNYQNIEEFEKKSSFEQAIIMPYVKRTGDYSISFSQKEIFITKLINSAKGNFGEAIVSQNPYHYDSLVDFDKLIWHANKIASYTQNLRNPEQNWSLDFFFYEWEGSIQLCLSEINYRQSFGQLFRILSKSLNKNCIGKYKEITPNSIDNIKQENLLNPISACKWMHWQTQIYSHAA